MGDPSPWLAYDWVTHTQYLLDSFRHWLGDDLIERQGDDEQQARDLFAARRVVVSHDTQPDPVFNYGNQQALDCWCVDIPQLLSMPSRKTAEALHRDERARLLSRTTEQGYVDDYRGIRITSTGKRFLIERAVVWNVLDAVNRLIGQAATFTDWTPLD